MGWMMKTGDTPDLQDLHRNEYSMPPNVKLVCVGGTVVENFASSKDGHCFKSHETIIRKIGLEILRKSLDTDTHKRVPPRKHSTLIEAPKQSLLQPHQFDIEMRYLYQKNRNKCTIPSENKNHVFALREFYNARRPYTVIIATFH